MIPLAEQIAELKREERLRKSVYARWTMTGKMTARQAEERQQRLHAAIETLEWLQRNEERIRAKVA